MELINFPAWMANNKDLTSDKVDAAKDKIIIGKVVNNLRDGSQFQAYSMTVEEAKALFSGSKELSFLLSYKGLVPLPESPIGIDIITNTENINVSTQYLNTGEYQLTFDQPVFADLNKVMVTQGPRNRRWIYNVGAVAPETFGNKLQMWSWYEIDDYSMIVEISYIEGANTNLAIKENLATNSTFLPITLKLG